MTVPLRLLPLAHAGGASRYALTPLLPRRWAAVTPEAMAHVLLDGALALPPLSRVIESAGLHQARN